MKSFFFPFFSLLIASSICFGQGSFVIESEKRPYDLLVGDSLIQLAITSSEIPFQKITEDLNGLPSSILQVDFNAKNGNVEVKSLQLDRENVWITINNFHDGTATRAYRFDATFAYLPIVNFINNLENEGHYFQSFPEEAEADDDGEIKSFKMWQVRKKDVVIASIYAINIPFYSFDDNNENYPPKAWNAISNLDINKLKYLAQNKDKK